MSEADNFLYQFNCRIVADRLKLRPSGLNGERYAPSIRIPVYDERLGFGAVFATPSVSALQFGFVRRQGAGLNPPPSYRSNRRVESGLTKVFPRDPLEGESPVHTRLHSDAISHRPSS